MSKKHWVKVDPATLKVGDEVKLIADGVKITGRLTLENGSQVRLGGFYFNCKGNDTNDREWYVRRPKPKPKPEPQRPDEPPRIAGTFVRVKRTGEVWLNWFGRTHWYRIDEISYGEVWEDITQPGDEIELLGGTTARAISEEGRR